MRREQITDEIMGVVHLINEVYTKFGFKYFIELSTRPENSMGSDEDWEAATNGLKNALEKLGLEYIINEGDGAFYGPKIDFHLEDSLGRTWQCGTIQLDFQMPLNFGLEYTDENNEKQRPIMIHRVCFGSIERFIGVLIEHFAGAFPIWLAPVQVNIIPVNNEYHLEYSKEILNLLKDNDVRVKLDDREEKLSYKMRESQTKKTPLTLILGDKERDENTISYRLFGSKETITVTKEEFIKKVKEDIASKVIY
jgi:threonyl-tRNA synthetase